jgi:hypothetical protein
MRAIERVRVPDDLELLVTAYQLSTDVSTRLGLLRLLEGLTLSRFVEKPRTGYLPWGSEVYERALGALDAAIEGWRSRRCRIEYQRVVSQSLNQLGAVGVDPLHPDACHVWGLILLEGDPRWWATAAHHLYRCGAPWQELSVLQAESEANLQRRDQLVRWLRLRDRQRPAKPAAP